MSTSIVATIFDCDHNMVNFGPLTAEIGLGVWGTPANSNRFRVLATLLYGSQVVSVSRTLRRWTEGATYVWQGDHHVGHCIVLVINSKKQIMFQMCHYVHYCTSTASCNISKQCSEYWIQRFIYSTPRVHMPHLVQATHEATKARHFTCAPAQWTMQTRQ